MEKEKVLKQIGLTDKEIKVYLATLELGQTTVNEIAKRAGVFRTYCYDILKSLTNKCLTRSIIRSGVQFFEAVETHKILDILREREENVRQILPELDALQGKIVGKTTAEVYDGKEGVKTIHDNILRSRPREVLVYGNTQKHIEVMGWNFPRYVKARVENKIRTRVITERTMFTKRTVLKKQILELRETRFFPAKLSFPTLKYIYGNKVAMISLGSTIMGVVIQDNEIAEGERRAFEILWGVSKRF